MYGIVLWSIKNKIKKLKTMKTSIIIAAKRAILIFTLFLGFHIQLVMAESPANSSPAKNTLALSVLAPVTPKEATFDDVLPEKAPVMVSLAPIAPKEATFDDVLPEKPPSMVSLAPVTPKEATFDVDDNSPEISTEFLKKVAPVTPVEADFNDPSPDEGINTCTIKFNVPLEASFNDL